MPESIQRQSDVETRIVQETQKPIISKEASMHEFRIKKLGAYVAYALGAAFAAAAIVTASLATFGIVPLVAVVGTASACAAVAGVALWRKVTPNLPAPLKAVSQYIQGVADEILGTIALLVLFPFNLERYDPTKKDQIKEGEIPVLFIHGFLGSSNNWVYQRRRLLEAGHKNLFTINLGDPRKSIVDYAKHVDEKIKEIQELTGSKDIIIVAHSMGGLVAKEFLYHQKTADINVKKIITLATPLAGTGIAKIAAPFSTCADQMRSNSKFTKDLIDEEIKDTKTDYLHFGGVPDLIVPRGSATAMPRPPRKITKIVDLEATGHIAELFSDTVGDYLVREVEEVQSAMNKELEAARLQRREQ